MTISKRTPEMDTDYSADTRKEFSGDKEGGKGIQGRQVGQDVGKPIDNGIAGGADRGKGYVPSSDFGAPLNPKGKGY